MQQTPRSIERLYLLLLLLHTLAASLIWGINTLFLLDAGLSNAQAFAANAFFTAGEVLFEVPTGVLADTRGRRLSYLLGTVTLAISTLLYVGMWRVHAPFFAWAIASLLLGLGFTFFSGAVEAWLVDALHATGDTQPVENVFARGKVVEGVAMLVGSGGYLAQVTSLGVPYVLRAVILCASFLMAFTMMRDLGFQSRERESLRTEIALVLRNSLRYGVQQRTIRWLMLASLFTNGVLIYAFYAMQPYLLKLWGDPNAYGIAGLAAAIVAGAQIVGGLSVKRVRGVFSTRTAMLLTGFALSGIALGGIAVFRTFGAAVALLVLWGLLFAMIMPVRQAFINSLIPSEQRATVLSFDSLVGSTGGVVTQPLLGRAADVWGYPMSYAICAVIELLALPFLWLARKEKEPTDVVERRADS